MEINTEELEKLSIADLVSLRNYVVFQPQMNNQQEIRYACVEELDKRISTIFLNK